MTSSRRGFLMALLVSFVYSRLGQMHVNQREATAAPARVLVVHRCWPATLRVVGRRGSCARADPRLRFATRAHTVRSGACPSLTPSREQTSSDAATTATRRPGYRVGPAPTRSIGRRTAPTRPRRHSHSIPGRPTRGPGADPSAQPRSRAAPSHATSHQRRSGDKAPHSQHTTREPDRRTGRPNVLRGSLRSLVPTLSPHGCPCQDQPPGRPFHDPSSS